MQWVQNTDQRNIDNLKTARCEASRHFRRKKNYILKAKINDLTNNSKNRNIEIYVEASVTFRKSTDLEII
jgi:hypothetical protein